VAAKVVRRLEQDRSKRLPDDPVDLFLWASFKVCSGAGALGPRDLKRAFERTRPEKELREFGKVDE